MNWTGGRLQRHSKANTNTTLRAQKQYFAKTRQRQHGPLPRLSPLRFSGFKVPTKTRETLNREQGKGRKRHQPSDHGDPVAVTFGHKVTCGSEALHDHHSKRRRLGEQASFHHISPKSKGQKLARSNIRSTHIHSNGQQRARSAACSPSQAGVNTLDRVKRDLLSRSDWMGLSAAQPINMKFASTRDSQNFGRRRKAEETNVQGPQKLQLKTRRNQVSGLVLDHHQTLGSPTGMQMEEASIRIGSNIHQTQTTALPSQGRRAASLICQSESSESMLLDKEVLARQRARDRRSSSRLVHCRRERISERPQESSMTASSVPLSALRHSKTFDEVKSRSDSMRNEQFAYCSQKPCRTVRRRAANRGPVADVPTSSSMVTGQRILDTTSLRSPTSDPDRQTGVQDDSLESCEAWSQPRQPTSSRNSHLSVQERDQNVGNPSMNISIGPRKQRLEGRFEKPNDPATLILSTSHQSQSPSRSKFTLELQAGNESQATSRFKGSDQGHHTTACDPDRQLSIYSPGDCSTSVGNDLTHSQLLAQRNLAEKDLAPAQLTDPIVSLNEDYPSSCRVTHHSIHGDTRPPDSSSEPSEPGAAGHVNDSAGNLKHPASQAGKRPGSGNVRTHEDQATMHIIELGHGNTSHESHATSRETSNDKRILGQERPQFIRPQQEVRSNLGTTGTIKSAVNTTIYKPNSNLEEHRSTDLSVSETDFLSQFSPMETKSDDRLLNLSTYNKPARTQRSHIATPISRLSRSVDGVQDDPTRSSRQDISTGSSPYHPGPCTSNERIAHARSTQSCATTGESTSDRTSMSENCHLLPHPPQRLFNRPGPSSRFKLSTQSLALELDPHQHEAAGQTCVDLLVSSNRSIRCHGRSIPMNLIPIQAAGKKRRRDSSTSDRPLSSYGRASCYAGIKEVRGEDGANDYTHNKGSFRMPWSQMPLLDQSLESKRGCPISHSDSQSPRYAYHQKITPATPSIHTSTYRPENLSTASLSTPARHNTFKKPLASSHFTNPATPIRPRSHRTALHTSKAMRGNRFYPVHSPSLPPPPSPAFSTPRPMRTRMGDNVENESTPLEPFSTPRRPLRSVLGEFKRPHRPIVSVSGW